MANEAKLAGDILAAYSDADATIIGPGHEVETSDGIFGKRVWKLLKQVGATTVAGNAAKGLCVVGSLMVGANPIGSFQVALSATLGARNFAGLRHPYPRAGILTAPDDLPQNTWGYFLVRGLGYAMLGNAAPALVANDYVMNDDAAGGGRVGGVAAATLAETLGAFAYANAASGGVTDEAALINIFKNCWGA